MPKKLTEEEVNKIINLYNLGVRDKVIAEKFNITRTRVCQIKKENNLKSQYEIEKEEIIKKATQMYEQGYSVTEIGKQTSTNRDTISKYLKIAGFTVKHGSVIRQKIKSNIFEPFDSKAQYWLGFLAADGNLPKSSSTSIGICTGVDPLHIHSFIDWAGAHKGLGTYQYNGKNTVKNGSNYYYSKRINSKESRDFLIDFGFTPNKSKTLKLKYITFPILRGIIDGDGSVKHVSKNSVCVVVYSASPYLSQQISEFLSEYSIENKVYSSSKNEMYYIHIERKNSVIKLYERLYEDCMKEHGYYLSRKRNKFSPVLPYDIV